MRNVLLVLLLIAGLEPAMGQASETPAPQNLQSLNWLQGSWNRLDTKAGRSGVETWTKVSDHQLKGLGVSMRGTDTAFVEKISIEFKDGGIYYVADVPGNAKPVYFKFTSITPNGFVCENPAHDFPKKIEYQLEGNILKAAISGNGKTIPYRFEKK